MDTGAWKQNSLLWSRLSCGKPKVDIGNQMVKFMRYTAFGLEEYDKKIRQDNLQMLLETENLLLKKAECEDLG